MIHSRRMKTPTLTISLTTIAMMSKKSKELTQRPGLSPKLHPHHTTWYTMGANKLKCTLCLKNRAGSQRPLLLIQPPCYSDFIPQHERPAFFERARNFIKRRFPKVDLGKLGPIGFGTKSGNASVVIGNLNIPAQHEANQNTNNKINTYLMNKHLLDTLTHNSCWQ